MFVMVLTSNGKLGASSSKLQEVPSLARRELAHCLQQVPHALAVHVEAVICLDGVHESCKTPLVFETVWGGGVSEELTGK